MKYLSSTTDSVPYIKCNMFSIAITMAYHCVPKQILFSAKQGVVKESFKKKRSDHDFTTMKIHTMYLCPLIFHH